MEYVNDPRVAACHKIEGQLPDDPNLCVDTVIALLMFALGQLTPDQRAAHLGFLTSLYSNRSLVEAMINNVPVEDVLQLKEEHFNDPATRLAGQAKLVSILLGDLASDVAMTVPIALLGEIYAHEPAEKRAAFRQLVRNSLQRMFKSLDKHYRDRQPTQADSDLSVTLRPQLIDYLRSGYT